MKGKRGSGTWRQLSLPAQDYIPFQIWIIVGTDGQSANKWSAIEFIIKHNELIYVLIWNSWAIAKLCLLVHGAADIWELYNSDKKKW